MTWSISSILALPLMSSFMESQKKSRAWWSCSIVGYFLKIAELCGSFTSCSRASRPPCHHRVRGPPPPPPEEPLVLPPDPELALIMVIVLLVLALLAGLSVTVSWTVTLPAPLVTRVAVLPVVLPEKLAKLLPDVMDQA